MSVVATSLELVHPAPSEVSVGADVALRVRVRAGGSDVAGGRIDVIAGEEVAATRALMQFREGANETEAFTVRAPVEVGAFTLTVAFPAQEIGGIAYGESALPVALRTRPHQSSLAVWGVSSPVRVGERFSVTVGAKSSGVCVLAGAKVEIRDDAGTVIGKGALGDTPWPETAALYWTEITLAAPSRPGMFRWSADFAAAELKLPHVGASAEFSFAAVKRPEHKLAVRVIEREAAAPVADVQVALGPYRAATDDTGLALLEAPAGEFELAVWKSGFEAPPRTVEIAADTSIEVEMIRLPEELKVWG